MAGELVLASPRKATSHQHCVELRARRWCSTPTPRWCRREPKAGRFRLFRLLALGSSWLQYQRNQQDEPIALDFQLARERSLREFHEECQVQPKLILSLPHGSSLFPQHIHPMREVVHRSDNGIGGGKVCNLLIIGVSMTVAKQLKQPSNNLHKKKSNYFHS